MTPAVAERFDLGLVPLWEERHAEPQPEVELGDSPAARARADVLVAAPDGVVVAPADSGDERDAAPALTLESVLHAGWRTLAAGFTTDCLLCGGTVHPRWSAGAGVVGGRCDDCGTALE